MTTYVMHLHYNGTLVFSKALLIKLALLLLQPQVETVGIGVQIKDSNVMLLKIMLEVDVI